MNQNSRTKNSVLNILTNMGYQCLVIFLAFFSRRIFINSLGLDYLGVSSLFTSIISVLALAELGIASAMSFSMYKYIAENNKEKLKALNTYYKQLYNRIALIILIIGIILLPFLKYIINLEQDIENLELYYIISLVNTVSSYLFIYKTTIVDADQKSYKLKVITCAIEILKFLVQIIILVILKNYLVYLLTTVLFTFLGNIIKSKLAEKWYPFIKEKAELNELEKKEIWSNIRAMFYYKIGGVVMQNTDNILISLIINTTTVGIYSNYNIIFTKIETFINLIFNAVNASVGNLNITASEEKKYKIYKVFMLITFWLYSLATIGIFFIGEDIVRAIMGTEKFILNKEIFIMALVIFYFVGICHQNIVYRRTTGLFKIAKYSILICSVLNLVLSVILGEMFGLFGILLATFISRLVTIGWYDPYLLYKKSFKKKVSWYYATQITRTLLCIATIMLMIPIIKLVTIGHLYIRILVKAIICAIIPNLVLFICYRKSEEFAYLSDKVKEIVKGFKLKKT